MPAKRDHTQTGFTLIEAMITLFVIAVGLLGIAALTAFGVGASHTAYMRSMASIHSENMAEMMRVNRAGVRANNYDTINFSTLAADSTNDCWATNCNAAQMAQADAAYWLSAVVRDLPTVPAGGNPQVQVACADGTTTCGANNTPHVITVRWSEKGDLEGQAAVVKQFTTVFRP